MEWRVFASTFVTLFLAELGDKTQLAAITLTAGTKRPLSVFCGAVSALAIVTLIGVVFGQAVVEVLPAARLKQIAAILFVAIGVAMFADWV